MLQPRTSATRAMSTLHLLELNIISAQDLHPVTQSMHTYAVAWVNPRSKLSTRVDADGHANPTWNDKFVFRIDDDFLRSDTSAVVVDVFCSRFFRDTPVGSVRVLLSSLFPSSALPQSGSSSPHHAVPARFVALQVRRPSGRPQGILNVGIALLNASMKSMPLYSNVSGSAVGFHDLIGDDDDQRYPHHRQQPPTHLRRTKSELRSELGVDDLPPFSTIETTDFPAAASVWSDSELGPSPSIIAAKLAADELKAAAEELRAIMAAKKRRDEELLHEAHALAHDEKKNQAAADTRETSTVDDYEVGSSILDDWSMPSPMGKQEDMKLKALERWRAELPPIYDAAPTAASFPSEGTPSRHSRGSHSRSKRKGESGGGGGLFSCFGDSYGCECSFFCGLNNPKKNGGGGDGGVPGKMPALPPADMHAYG